MLPLIRSAADCSLLRARPEILANARGKPIELDDVKAFMII
jgi:hypothetical protein